MISQRFVSLCTYLSVVLESKIPRDRKIEEFLAEGVNLEDVLFAYHPQDEKRLSQIWHPGRKTTQKGQEYIIFSVATNGEELFCQLIFRARCMAVMARKSEDWTFGFEKTTPGPNCKYYDFISLAFPGISGEFEPVYVKMRPYGSTGTDDCFVKVSAVEFSERGLVVVACEEAKEEDVPSALRAHTFD